MENSDLNFRKLPLMNANGTAFFGISGKEYNLTRFTKIFANCLPGVNFRSIWLFARNLLFNFFAFRKFNYFRIVCILSQEYLVLFDMSPFQNFRNFWLNGKRPWLSKIPWRHYLNSQSMQIQFHNEPITPSRQFTVNLCNCRNARERLATTVKWGKALTAPSVM